MHANVLQLYVSVYDSVGGHSAIKSSVTVSPVKFFFAFEICPFKIKAPIFIISNLGFTQFFVN